MLFRSAFFTDVGSTVHRQHVLFRQQEVLHGEHGLLHFTGVAHAGQQDFLLREVDDHATIGVGAITLRHALEVGHVEHLPLVLAGEDYREMEQKIRPIAQALCITELLDKYPYEVSGGQKQRAAVARALITDPKLILADEPTGALDSKAASALLSMFGEINDEGQTILMVTHSAQAASHASRVLFIKDGEVFHQIYKGSKSRQEMYQMIADTLTILTTGGEYHA